MYHKNEAITSIATIIVFVLFIVGALCMKCVPYNQRSAENELDSFIKEWNIDAGKRSCQFSDSDGNGYNTCQYYDNKNQELVEVECAAQFNLNHGCKTIKNTSVRRQSIVDN